MDLFLLDEAADAEENDAPGSSSSASAESDDTEADLAKWRADLVRSSETRRLEYDLGDPADDVTDDEQS